MAEMMSKVEKNMQKGINTCVVFKDELVAVDLIPRLKIQP